VKAPKKYLISRARISICTSALRLSVATMTATIFIVLSATSTYSQLINELAQRLLRQGNPQMSVQLPQVLDAIIIIASSTDVTIMIESTSSPSIYRKTILFLHVARGARNEL
jgi:Na+-translocating ferredoxin:NAD+ oxidoreductase RnfA subunit